VAQVFEPLSKAADQTNAFTAAMEALTKTYDDAITKARDLGLATETLEAKRSEALTKMRADAQRGFDAAVRGARGESFVDQLLAVRDNFEENGASYLAAGRDPNVLYAAQISTIVNSLDLTQLATAIDVLRGVDDVAVLFAEAARVAGLERLQIDRARDLDIIDRTMGARRMTLSGDSRGASLAEFDLRAEAELRVFGEQLFNLGLDRTGDEYRRRVVTLEQTIAEERLAVMREFDRQAQQQAEEAARQAQQQAERMRAITQGLFENLTLGDLGGLPLEARYGAALTSLSAAQRPLLDGATPDELAEFARVAQIALPIAKDFLGVSGSFAELVADVSRTLRTAAPSSDPANLSALLEAQVAGADRLELAVIGTGQAQTDVLKSLLTELKRLTAQNEAILARQAA